MNVQAASRAGQTSYLASLNDAQKRAVEFGGAAIAAPLLIIAGAGSGKTNTLGHRVAYLLHHGADPRRMMLLTFSRRAASEMQRRVDKISSAAFGLNGLALSNALEWSGTFHGIGARLLREYALEIGLDRDFTIHDREDSADLMNLVRHELNLSKTDRRFPTKGTCLAIYSRCVNAQAALGLVLAANFSWCVEWEAELRQLFAAYVEAKQRQNVLDYDDLLLYWAQMMAEASIAQHLSERFDHVFVDEYQDTNQLQSAILLGLKPTGAGLTVVGDDAQSIYSFRAATVRNILDFPAQFSPPAHVITLEQNYRSTQPILEAANSVIEFASERFTKNLWSNRASIEKPRLVNVADDFNQCSYIAEQILSNREDGMALKSQAVLFRASHHSASLEVELTRRNIPFVKFGGLKFLEAAHIKDVLAILRWGQNPRDRVSGFRVAQLMPGTGPAAAARLLDTINGSLSLSGALASFKPPAATSECWPAFIDLCENIGSASAAWPATLDAACQWYAPHLEQKYEDAAVRQLDLVQLLQIAAAYPSRERFLTELTLDPPDATSDEAGPPLQDEDYLILSTIHSAKGQEWKSVFVLNVVDGCIPVDLAASSKQELEEERRLLYVAMTRAKDSLHLMVPQRFFVQQQRTNGDRHVYAQRTRFIPQSILGKFENCYWPSNRNTGGKAINNRPASIDLKSKLRGMWT